MVRLQAGHANKRARLFFAARRNQILDAATRVFSEKGFHRATIRDVAQVAGIADGTIYNYFDNKAALMVGILHRLNETPERAGHLAQAANLRLAAKPQALRWRPGLTVRGLEALPVGV